MHSAVASAPVKVAPILASTPVSRWLQRENAAAPSVEHLRRWQTFVANNLEFKLGVAVGAAVAEAWNANAAIGGAKP